MRRRSRKRDSSKGKQREELGGEPREGQEEQEQLAETTAGGAAEVEPELESSEPEEEDNEERPEEEGPAEERDEAEQNEPKPEPQASPVSRVKAWFKRRRSSPTREGEKVPAAVPEMAAPEAAPPTPTPPPVAEQPPQLPRIVSATTSTSAAEAMRESAEPREEGKEGEGKEGEGQEGKRQEGEGQEGRDEGGEEGDDGPLGSHPVRTSEVERLKKGNSSASSHSGGVGVLDALKATFSPHYHSQAGESSARLSKKAPVQQEDDREEASTNDQPVTEASQQEAEKHTARGSRFSEKL